MALKVVHLLQAYTNGVFCTFVLIWTDIVCLCCPSAVAELLVLQTTAPFLVTMKHL